MTSGKASQKKNKIALPDVIIIWTRIHVAVHSHLIHVCSLNNMHGYDIHDINDRHDIHDIHDINDNVYKSEIQTNQE